MIFSKILQCLIYFGLILYPLSQAGAKPQAESKSTSSTPDKKREKPTKKAKVGAAELNVTAATAKDNIEEKIKAQLKDLNVLQPKGSAKSVDLAPLPRQLAKVELSKKHRSLAVDITPDKEIGSVAVFAQGSIWYLVLGGVTDIDIPSFDVNMIPGLVGIDSLKSETGEAILKIVFKSRQTPTVTQTSKGVSIDFQHKYQTINCNDLIQLPQKPQDPYCIRVRFSGNVVEFEDPATHHSFWVLTSEKPFRAINEYSYPEFTLLPSEMGVAIDKISEDLEIDYHRRKVSISLENGLSVSPRFPIESGITAQSIFGEFSSQKAPDRIIALNRLTSHASNQVLQKNIELIWQYLGLGKVPEALNLVNLLHESYPDIVLMPTFRALDGLTQLLVNRSSKAVELLDVLSYDPEPKFWYRLAAASKNEFIDTDSLHNLINYKAHFQLLPTALQARVQGLILQTAVLHKDNTVLETFSDKKFYPDDIFGQQLFKLAQAIIMLNDKQKNRAIKQLKALSQNLVSQRVATLAAFELLKVEEQEKTVKPEEILATLNRLRFSWRGDFLEYYISKHYVKQLEEQKQYAKALPVLRSLIKYFPEQAHRDKLPELMQKNLLDFFDKKPAPSLMESLSIFQEYGDLAPNNEQGDHIILKATGELVKLDLYQDALDILKKYLDKKLQDKTVSPDRKKLFLYKIAAIELLAKDPQECLRTLGGIKDPSKDIIDDVALLKAEALKQNGQIDAAISSLGETPLQIEKKGELYFTKQNWVESATKYQNAFELFPETDKENRSKCIFNLALCYALSNNKDKLNDLKETYRQLMDESKYKEMFNFLISDTAFSGALTSTEFSKIDNFADNLKKVF
ncbi:tetratricopeptide repeat protein [Candidatus Paracaedibacter symbiosus]|uniref:tetratricopeptide repeat protein n=1 Tax=Candidatus Paracaedibacter symbiosus TaxID=244582 RepID=UPI0005095268|nr:hypothetical protein [Candidatus Paracaedibacter symbiosus]